MNNQPLIQLAKNALQTAPKPLNGLPCSQVTVILTQKGERYIAVNDIDGSICRQLKAADDTVIVRMVTLWQDGQADVPSAAFRTACLSLNENNGNAEVLLQGEEGVVVKPLHTLL